MSTVHQEGSFDLSPGHSIELQDAELFEITSLGGNIWITQSGDLRDTVLKKGQFAILDRPGTALISALGGPARVQTALRIVMAAAA